MRKVIQNVRWWEDGEPTSLVVEDGVVVSKNPISSPEGTVIEGGGRCLMPGFVDAHCHILPMGLDLQKLHLGNCHTKQDVLDLVADACKGIQDDSWLHAVHYDQTKFENAVHITRHDLDPITLTRPILLRHANGHASIANSAALQAAGVDKTTKDPSGGSYLRDEDGTPNGVLLERAHELVTDAAPHPTVEEMVVAILAAGDAMALLGITCASDMMTGRWDLANELTAYRLATEQGCKVRLRLYLQWGTVLGSRAISRENLNELQSAMPPKACDIRGLKIFADGAISSATAAIYGSFLTTGADGQLIYEPERLKSMVKKGHDHGFAIAIHSIGDRATDLVLDAIEETGDPSRHRLEHAMLLSDAQIERLARVGCHTTMQPEFLLRFAHAYQKQLEPARAARIKRFRSVMNAGVSLSFSSDRPIVPGDPWDGILTAENRPEGFDSNESVTRKIGIKNYTEGGAIANGDSDWMGSLKNGQIADFQLVSEDPLSSRRPKTVATFLAGEQTSSCE